MIEPALINYAECDSATLNVTEENSDYSEESPTRSSSELEQQDLSATEDEAESPQSSPEMNVQNNDSEVAKPKGSWRAALCNATAMFKFGLFGRSNKSNGADLEPQIQKAPSRRG